MSTNAEEVGGAYAEQRLAYGIAEAADLIGCSPGHIRNLIERKELSSVKVGRRRMVRAEDLRALLARGLETETAAAAA